MIDLWKQLDEIHMVTNNGWYLSMNEIFSLFIDRNKINLDIIFFSLNLCFYRSHNLKKGNDEHVLSEVNNPKILHKRKKCNYLWY